MIVNCTNLELASNIIRYLLLCYRISFNSTELFQALMDLWHRYTLRNAITNEIKERIYIFIVQWILYWGCIDFTPQLCAQMAKFADVALSGYLNGLAQTQIKTLMCSDQVFKSPPGQPVEEVDDTTLTPKDSRSRKRLSRVVTLPLNMLSPRSSNINLMEYDTEVICIHLTSIETTLFKNIRITEFLNNNWLKPNKHQVAVGLCNISDHFNKVVNWVASQVITALSLKSRMRIFNKFLRITRVSYPFYQLHREYFSHYSLEINIDEKLLFCLSNCNWT